MNTKALHYTDLADKIKSDGAICSDWDLYINNACKAYRDAWNVIKKGEFLNNEIFSNYLKAHNMDPAECELGNCGIEGAPRGLNSWKNVIAVIKKFHKMKNSPENVITELQSEVKLLKDKINNMNAQISKLNALLEKNSYIIGELSDKILSIQRNTPVVLGGPNSMINDPLENMKSSLDRDTTSDPDKIAEMRDADMDDFDSIVKTGKTEKHISSKGIPETHVIHNSQDSRNKGNDITSDAPEKATSVVYDTRNPNMTQREAELAEAKAVLESLRKEKDALERHPLDTNNTEENKHSRWLEAIQKDRLRKSLGVDTSVLTKDGFDVDDPANSMFNDRQ